jgi:hypothetical protein
MKRTIFTITILSVCLSGSVTFGIAPIGQPATNLQKGIWKLGADYSDTKIDLLAENTKDAVFFNEGIIEDFKINLILGKAGYGITDGWEVFAGFGTSKTDLCTEQKMQWGDSASIETDTFDLSSGTDYAAQIGTKLTLYERALFKAGVTCQYTWFSMSGTLTKEIYKDDTFFVKDDIDLDSSLTVLQIAPGVSYQLLYGVSVYGGPLFQRIDGKIDGKYNSEVFTGKGSVDIKEDSSFGGWVGLQADIDIYTSFNVEYQMTGSSSTIGLSLSSKF